MQTTPTAMRSTCQHPQFRPLDRYRRFLLSRETLVTLTNSLLLAAGFVVSTAGAPHVGQWLYLASALVGGTPLFLSAARGLLWRRDLTAGVMVSVAWIAAIVVSEYGAAALVVFMMAVGEWLENLTVARADDALKNLATLIPTTVTVQRDGREVVVPLSEVGLGEVVLLRSGERVGTDGVVIAGQASVNQAAITGESMPVEKKAGDKILAGTLDELGTLRVRVTRLGEDTTLGQMIKLVKDAQASQAPVQRLANRYAQFLVPLTFALAVLVYIWTGDITRSITVLVVVCPCSLVLSTPTAVAAAIGNAARRGILVRSGAGIERIGRADTVAFDKTGTLTWGQPELREIVPLDRLDAVSLLWLAATAERFSEHPIGRCLVQAAQEQQLTLGELTDFTPWPGYGITARVEGCEVVVGTRALLCDRGIAWPAEAGKRAALLEREGHTVIPVAVGGRVGGLIAVADTLRPGARAAVTQLKRLGVEQIIMISGDGRPAVARVARELGIDCFHAEVLPEDKLRIIRSLQAAGRTIAYAGDGVNDAPALAAADISVAMGVSGTDVAIETAAISLMADEIERLPQIIDLSRRMLHVIRENVVFSMSVNVLSVALGSLGIIGPVLGAAMHELSALPVLLNAARLINYRIDAK